MPDQTNALLCRWAQERLGIDALPVRVEFLHDEGWGGTDVTPGEPAEVYARVFFDGGEERSIRDITVTTDLIREILAAADTGEER